jgi:hypothetical protein
MGVLLPDTIEARVGFVGSLIGCAIINDWCVRWLSPIVDLFWEIRANAAIS